MTGLSREDRFGSRMAQILFVLAGVAAGVLVVWDPWWWTAVFDAWWSTAVVVVVAGWFIAAFALVKWSVYTARLLGLAVIASIVILRISSGWWMLFAVGPLALVLAVVLLRIIGGRKVDVVATDRTAVPILADEGNRLVDAMDAVWGSTRPGGPRCGLRAAHPHGSVAEGTWTTRYRHRDGPIGVPLFAEGSGGRAVARFSNFSGEVTRDDRAWAPHGLAIRLEGGAAGTMDVVLVDVKRFPSATREDFVTFTGIFGRRGIGRHRRLLWHVFTGRTSLSALLGSFRWPPSSYVDRRYFGLNTFCWRLRAAKKDLVPVRYVAEPTGRRQYRRRSRSPNELDQELRLRLADRTVRFDIVLEVARTTGPRRLSKARLNSPLDRWPRSSRRTSRPLCTVELTDYRGTEDAGLRFDPLRLPEGVEPSDDEILRARAAAYATSYLRRYPVPAPSSEAHAVGPGGQ